MEEGFVLADRQEKLAHAFIEEYLSGEGYALSTLHELPPDKARALMVKASVYSSIRLAEIEERARLVESWHHAMPEGEFV